MRSAAQTVPPIHSGSPKQNHLAPLIPVDAGAQALHQHPVAAASSWVRVKCGLHGATIDRHLGDEGLVNHQQDRRVEESLAGSLAQELPQLPARHVLCLSGTLHRGLQVMLLAGCVEVLCWQCFCKARVSPAAQVWA